MSSVFVQPARDKVSAINLRKSIDRKVSQQLVDQLPGDQPSVVRGCIGLEDFRVWAPPSKPINAKYWGRMGTGDTVLLYPPGEARQLRRFEVVSKVHSAELGELIWGRGPKGEVFEHLYTLSDELPCSMTVDGFNQALGYEPNNKIQGFGCFEGLKARSLLDALNGGSEPEAEDFLEDVESAKEELERLDPTERDAIIKSRIGQGKFREKLVERWKRCAVTGVTNLKLLRASHIKPWKVSSNAERLSVDNGLLLLVNYDYAFDAGLISFRDDGTMIVSSSFSEDEIRYLGISRTARIKDIPPGCKSFLDHHRNSVMKKLGRTAAGG